MLRLSASRKILLLLWAMAILATCLYAPQAQTTIHGQKVRPAGYAWLWTPATEEGAYRVDRERIGLTWVGITAAGLAAWVLLPGPPGPGRPSSA